MKAYSNAPPGFTAGASLLDRSTKQNRHNIDLSTKGLWTVPSR